MFGFCRGVLQCEREYGIIGGVQLRKMVSQGKRVWREGVRTAEIAVREVRVGAQEYASMQRLALILSPIHRHSI